MRTRQFIHGRIAYGRRLFSSRVYAFWLNSSHTFKLFNFIINVIPETRREHYIWRMYLNRSLRCVNRCLLQHNSTLTTISLRKGALSLALFQIRCCCSLLQVKHLKYINLNWLLKRMHWIICDLRINRTPSSVFDWWKHYSGLTFLWMQ